MANTRRTVSGCSTMPRAYCAGARYHSCASCVTPVVNEMIIIVTSRSAVAPASTTSSFLIPIAGTVSDAEPHAYAAGAARIDLDDIAGAQERIRGGVAGDEQLRLAEPIGDARGQAPLDRPESQADA